MLKTRFCDLMKIELPIVSAGMGGVALAELAAAVSNAGGLGTIALAGFTPEAIHQEISSGRQRTKNPIAVNFLIPFFQPEPLAAALASKVDAVTFFWGDDPDNYIRTCHQAGTKVIWQCGSAAEARQAARSGPDAIIAQGHEAGGHARGTVSTLALIPKVRDAIGDTPMLAAGGVRR